MKDIWHAHEKGEDLMEHITLPVCSMRLIGSDALAGNHTRSEMVPLFDAT